jgi:NADPH:quinone reductase-like Zn-dependent oxidoreductase
MIARKPESLNFRQAASAPVVAVTAWQALFEYAKATPGETVLVHGAGGNVGAYAVQLAVDADLQVIATASAQDDLYLRSLGATTVTDYKSRRFEDLVPKVDIVLDTVGGETRERSFGIIKPGGVLVSAVSKPLPNGWTGSPTCSTGADWSREWVRCFRWTRYAPRTKCWLVRRTNLERSC